MKEKIKQIVFTNVNTAELIDMGEIDFNNVKDDEIIVKTEISSISSGTEKANITGSPSVNCTSAERVCFPRYCGYSSAGVVVKTGKNVTKVSKGDRVAVYNSMHKNYNVTKESRVVKLDDATDFSTGALLYISTFPLAALRKTKLEIGESCMVMGLGILGQLAVRFARNMGATPIIAVDLNEERRQIALDSGADYALDPTDSVFAEKVKALTNGGAKVVIEVTGRGEALNQALDCTAKLGRVALLGCTRESNFTIDYYRKVHGPGISLIGAHTNARPNVESAPSLYTHLDDMSTTMRLCLLNRLKVTDLVGEMARPQDCKDVYDRLISGKNYPICVQFDWNKL